MKTEKNNSFNQLLLIISLFLIFIITARAANDADMWWHLSAGKEMLQSGTILLTDVFSHTRYGEPWVNAFWLADLMLYGVFSLFQFTGITVFTALMAALTFGILYLKLAAPSFIKFIATCLVGFAIAPIWGPRPQLFSFLFLAILINWLNSRNNFPTKKDWLLIPFFVIWANLHGGFFWGILLLIAYSAGDWLEKLQNRKFSNLKYQFFYLPILTLFAWLAVLINPNGWALWKLPFYTVDVSLQSIQEWASPNFHRLDFHPMLWIIFIIFLGLNFSSKKVPWGNLFAFIGFGYMAFVSQRSIGPFLIVTLPLLVTILSDAWEEAIRKKIIHLPNSNEAPKLIQAIANAFIISLLTLFAILRVYSTSQPAAIQSGYPQGAVQWLMENQPAGPLFNSYNWGGYLIWSLPQYPVYIDGRADLYGDELISEWWQIVNASPQGLLALENRKVNLLLLEPNWPIVQQLIELNWQIGYQDDHSIILMRP